MRLGRELVGWRALVITDEFFVAEFVAQALAERGGTVLGTARTLGEARAALAADRPPDVAVLDADLRLGEATPAAAALKARGVPFVVVTRLPVPLGPELRAAPRVRKPLRAEWLVRAVARAARSKGRNAGAAAVR